MRIIFNLHGVGLGNNGGSRTVVKSAETLASLEQEVIIASNIKNKYTWEKIGKKVQFIRSKSPPKGDVIIATGIRSVRSTLASKIKKKFYYIRGFETWRTKKSKLFKSFRSLRCIVNSGWLKDLLNKNNIDCDIVYNGLDFHDFYNMEEKRNNPLGGLYGKKVTKNTDFVKLCAEKASIPLLLLNKSIKKSTPEQLNKWYNTIKVWQSSSELEGLHNPPMEASLSGCGLVATDSYRGGTSDYVIPGETALVYKNQDVEDALDCIVRLVNDNKLRENLNKNMIDLLKTKIGTREKNMYKMLDIFKR